MSRIRFQAKLNGRKILSGNWPRALLITLLWMLLSSGVILLEESVRKVTNIPQMIGSGAYSLPNTSILSLVVSGIFTVVLFFFMTPLQIGQAEWYWHLVDRKETPIGDVFGWYGSLKLYGKSLMLQIHILWRMLLWGIAVFAAPAALLVFYEWGLHEADTLFADIIFGLGILLLVCASVIWIFLYMRYFLAPYLLVEDSTRKTNACVRTAARYSKGFYWEIVKFQLSFILWWLLCYLILPLFYVMPYYHASAAVFSRHIIYTQGAKEQNPSA